MRTPKLKGLKSELGEDTYKAVTTSLVELNEDNPSSRYPNPEIWNFKEGRKASLKEGYSVALEKLKIVGKNNVGSSPIIAATDPSHSALSCLDVCEIPDAVVSCPIIAATDPRSSSPSGLDGCEIPDAVFHDFMAYKVWRNFESGQIWVCYCHPDELPRYYVLITGVKSIPFELHVQHLDSSYPTNRMMKWADENMPICCGTFTVDDETEVYKDIKASSHMLYAYFVSKGRYTIYPREGEVWAVYKNFKPKWTLSNLKTCMYDIVEVYEVGNQKIVGFLLELVGEFKTVFKRKIDSKVIDITHANSLKISHQILAFQLTDQQNGSLRGYWELNPNSIPVHYFSSDWFAWNQHYDRKNLLKSSSISH